MASNVTVKDSTGATLTMKTTESGGVHTPHQIISGYDTADDMVKIKSMQKKFRDSFNGTSVDSTKWESVIGSGGSISVGGGQITIGSGTVANSETYILSKDVFTIPFRISTGLLLSQRIANQSFFIEAVSVDSTTGIPDGLNSAALLFDGTSATQAKYRVQNGGLTPLDSSASTFPTSSSGSVYELEPFADECWFHGGTLDSTNARSNSYRRHQQVPDPNSLYKIRIRWVNSSTPPASNTNTVIQYIACQDYAELTAEITAGRGQTVAGQGIAVTVAGTATTSISGSPTVVSQDNMFWSDAVTSQAVTATFTGSSRDVGVAAGSVHRYSKFNVFALADQAGTVRAECSNDNSTWRRSTVDTAVTANVPIILSVPIMTRYYRAVYINGNVAQTMFMLNTSFTAS